MCVPPPPHPPTHPKVATFLAVFGASVMLGRKIAIDEDFRNRYVPSWYDFSIRKPPSALSRDELHESLVEMQTDLHHRAIRGEFTPERLERMRQHFAGVDDLEQDDDDDEDDNENSNANEEAGSSWK